MNVMKEQKRTTEKEIREAIRKAVTVAWDAGYKAGKNGEREDCKSAVLENIISDTWDKIKGAVNDLLDAIGDWVSDKWDDAKKKLDDIWGDIIPWN